MKDTGTTSVICAVALEEDAYIQEWIIYHFLLGFDAIYIYDNSIDNCLRSLDGSYKSRVIVIHFPGKVKQAASYNHFLNTHKEKFTFGAFIDCDEFIVLKTSRYINSFLESKDIEAGLAVSWSMFGSNFREASGAGRVLRRFVRRSKSLDDGVKCIVRLSHVDEYSHPHYPTKKQGTVKDAMGRLVNGWSNPQGDDSEIVLFHFWTKSKEEFFRKVGRGRADDAVDRPGPLLSFYEFNLRANEVLDDTALRFFESCATETVNQDLLRGLTDLATCDLCEPAYSERENQMLELLQFAAQKVGPLHLWDLQRLILAATGGIQEQEHLTAIRLGLQEITNKNKKCEELLRTERAQSEILRLMINSQLTEMKYLQEVVQSALVWQKRAWFQRAFHQWTAPKRGGLS